MSARDVSTDNNIGADGVKALSDFLPHTIQLRELYLSGGCMLCVN